MKFLIMASSQDSAGMNIINNLKSLNSKIPVHITDELLISAENIDKNLNYDFIIFASRHKAKDNKKTLTVHTIGNWNSADLGGKKETLPPTSAQVFKHFFKTLNKTNDLDYEVTLEATHHGPYLKTPCLFIEIGPSEKEWSDKAAGMVIAKTIISAIDTFKINKKLKSCIGFGGPHYCPNFNEIQLGNTYAISFIVPSYALPIKKDLIAQAINETAEKPTIALLDWKGFKSQQRIELLETLKQFNLEVLKTKEAKNH